MNHHKQFNHLVRMVHTKLLQQSSNNNKNLLILSNLSSSLQQRRSMGYAFWPKKAAEKMQKERSGNNTPTPTPENTERLVNPNKKGGQYFYEKPLTESEKEKVDQFSNESNYPLPQRVEQIFNKVAPVPKEYGVGQPRAFLRIAGKRPQFLKLAIAIAILLISLQIINHYGTIFLLDDIVKELLNARPDIESVFATHDRSTEKVQLHHQYVSEMDEILSFLDKSLEADETLTKYYLQSGVIDKLVELLQKSEHPFILLHSLTTLEKCVKYDPKCVEYLVKEKGAIEMLNDKLLKLGYEMIQEKRIPLNKLLNPIVKLLIKLYSENNEWITDKDRQFLALGLQLANPKYFHKMALEIVQNLATNQMNRINTATEQDYSEEQKRSALEKSVISRDVEFMHNLQFLAQNAPIEEVRTELTLILESLQQSHDAFVNKSKVSNPIDVSPLHNAGFKETMYRKYEMGPKEAIGNVLYLFMIPFMMGWLRYRWMGNGAPVPFIRWTMFHAAKLFLVTDFILAPVSTFLFDPSKSDFSRNYMMKSPDLVFLGSLCNRTLAYALQLKAFADTYFIAFPYLMKQYEGTQFSVIKSSPPVCAYRMWVASQLVKRKQVYGQIPFQTQPILVKQTTSETAKSNNSSEEECH